MEADLIQTLHTQYQLLDRLQVRWLYCERAPNVVAGEFHREYGTYAREWDQWLLVAEEIQQRVEADMEQLMFESDEIYHRIERNEYGSDTTATTQVAISPLTHHVAELAYIDAEIAAHREVRSQILFAEMLDTLE